MSLTPNEHDPYLAPAANTAAQKPAGIEVPKSKKRPVSRWLTPLLAVVDAIGAGLFGGIAIGQHTASSTQAMSNTSSTAGGTRTAGGMGGTPPGGSGTGSSGAAGGGITSGTVVSVSGDTVVIKTSSGSTVTLTTTASTKVTKTTTSSVSALKAGERVTALGKTSNGKLSATTITEGASGFGGGAPGGSSGSTNG